jgi:hypothetical protein
MPANKKKSPGDSHQKSCFTGVAGLVEVLTTI